MTAGVFTKKDEGESQNWIDWREASIYKVLRDLYYSQGGIGGTDGQDCYLIPNSEEMYYKTRTMLTPFTSWYMLFIDAQYLPLYTVEPPNYENVTESLQDGFINNCNRAGASLDDYKMGCTQNSLMDGVVFCASSYDANPELEPSFHYYTAGELNQCLTEVDVYGAITKYVFTQQKQDKNNEKYFTHDVYEGFTYTEYRSEDIEELGKITTATVDSMEIREVYSQRREQGRMLPNPKSRGIAGLCISIYNSESDQRWVLRMQGHSILVITSDVVPEKVNAGVTKAMHIDSTENQGNAEFVSPPAALSKEHRESKAELISQLFELMRHGGVIAQKTSQIPESGAAKAFTFAPVNAAVGNCRNMAKEIDRYVVDSFLYYKKQVIDFDVVYKQDFTPDSDELAIDLIALVAEMKAAKIDGGFKAGLKQIAMRLEAGEAVMDEIDNISLDYAVDVE